MRKILSLTYLLLIRFKERFFFRSISVIVNLLNSYAIEFVTVKTDKLYIYIYFFKYLRLRTNLIKLIYWTSQRTDSEVFYSYTKWLERDRDDNVCNLCVQFKMRLLYSSKFACRPVASPDLEVRSYGHVTC
jgi:hypothetical protein